MVAISRIGLRNVCHSDTELAEGEESPYPAFVFALALSIP
jgi:hypothetical protein